VAHPPVRFSENGKNGEKPAIKRMKNGAKTDLAPVENPTGDWLIFAESPE
jgi:hypothetical protein